MALLDVGTGFTITFLEDKFELRNISSLAHISPKHMLCHLNVHLLEEALQKKKKKKKEKKEKKCMCYSNNSLRTH